MAVFRDGTGTEWVLEVNTWQLRVVRERTGFELGRLLEDGMSRWVELAADPVLFGSVLMALCADQVATRSTTERQFHTALAGEALEAAHDAFREAFLNFCPSRQRTILVAAQEKGREMQEAQAQEALQKIGALAPAATSSGSVGSSPESSDSTPAG